MLIFFIIVIYYKIDEKFARVINTKKYRIITYIFIIFIIIFTILYLHALWIDDDSLLVEILITPVKFMLAIYKRRKGFSEPGDDF
jgi:hypothetical protein